MRGWALVAVTAVSCIDPGQFICTSDGDCLSPEGRCEAGNCVMVDADCPLGRYSEYAAPDLAGRCFEADSGSTSVVEPATTADDATTSPGGTTGASGDSSSSGEPIPVEVCNGIDDNDNGLVDEWSPDNVQCDLCPGGGECLPCDLFPDDTENPTRVYYLCEGANYNQIVGFCTDLQAPFASIHDDAENTFLSIKTAEFTMYASAYIGLRDFGDVGAPAWTWVDGSEFSYEQLGADLDVHEVDDVCVAIGTSGEWTATHCNGGKAFFCEAPL
jgi:hypothetical protein